MDVYLRGIVTENSPGLIINVTTSNFSLPRGIKRIRSTDIETIHNKFI